MTCNDDPRDVHMSPEEIQTAVQEAHRLGKHVMAHAHSAQGRILDIVFTLEGLFNL